MLEKAQALKEKNNLEISKGKRVIPTFTNDDLVFIASKVGIDLVSQDDGSRNKAQEIRNLENLRDHTFAYFCQYNSCSHKTVTGELPPGHQEVVLDQKRKQGKGDVYKASFKATEGSQFASSSQYNPQINETLGVDPETPRTIHSSLDEVEWS